MIYLDHNATSPSTTEHFEKLFFQIKNSAGNPSSPHASGRDASVALTQARRFVAQALEVDVAQLIFVSGATEANNMATVGVLRHYGVPNSHAICSAIEHPSVIEPLDFLSAHEGLQLTIIESNSSGFVSIEKLIGQINSNTKLITLMAANNEVGSLQEVQILGDFLHYMRWGVRPLQNIDRVLSLENCLSSDVTKENLQNLHFHVDAVQAFGKLPTSCWMSLGIDSCSVSAHKLGALQGVGALFLRRGRKLYPTILGGAQEKNRRSGTENLPGIISFGLVAQELLKSDYWVQTAEMHQLRNELFDSIAKLPNIYMNSPRENSLPNTINFSLENIPKNTNSDKKYFIKNGEDLLLELDLRGVCASSGSACSSGANLPSKVLLAMDRSPSLAKNAIRISLSVNNNKNEIIKVIDILKNIIGA
jgi:cysteine desulfurase